MNRNQFKIIESIIKNNTPSHWIVQPTNGQRREGIYIVKYCSKYGKLDDFKSIRGYRYEVDPDNEHRLFVDYDLLAEYQTYIDNRMDFYLFKLTNMVISLIAIILSLFSILT